VDLPVGGLHRAAGGVPAHPEGPCGAGPGPDGTGRNPSPLRRSGTPGPARGRRAARIPGLGPGCTVTNGRKRRTRSRAPDSEELTLEGFGVGDPVGEEPE